MAKKKECIFCRIVRNDLPAFKIYEDKYCIAILDIFPNIKGMTLVIPKKHMDSYLFKMSDRALKEFVVETKKVAKLLEKKLKVGRVHLVLEGTGVDHIHAKLYPAIGTNKQFKEIIAEERVYFKSYPGYVSTLMGPRASDKELAELQKKIIS